MKKQLGILFLALAVGCAVDNRFDSVPEGEGFPGYATDSGTGGGGPSSGGQTGTGSSASSGGAQNTGGTQNTGGAQNTGGTQNTGGGSTGGGSTGGAQNTGGGNTGGGGSVEQQIFDGTGVSIEPGSNTVGINGFFFVLEDSVADGIVKNDPYLDFSDLDPDSGTGASLEPSSFETSSSPCVSGTIQQVTAADGYSCDDNYYPCMWDEIWGGGIGLTLNEPDGGSKEAWDADAAGVNGFSFTTSGTSGAQLRVYLIDTSGEQFCTVVTLGQTVDVDITDFTHNCWQPDSVELDPSEIEQMTWQFASSNGYEYPVDSLCVTNLEVY